MFWRQEISRSNPTYHRHILSTYLYDIQAVGWTDNVTFGGDDHLWWAMLSNCELANPVYSCIRHASTQIWKFQVNDLSIELCSYVDGTSQHDVERNTYLRKTLCILLSKHCSEMYNLDFDILNVCDYVDILWGQLDNYLDNKSTL